VKKLFSVLAIALVLASCSSTTEQTPVAKDFVVTVTTDTTITRKEPITAPRFSCDKRKLPQPKLVGMRDVTNPLSITKEVTIPADSLSAGGWYWFSPDETPEKTGSTFSWFPGWLKSLLEVLFWIAVIAFALWLLWQILSALFRNLSAASSPAVAPVATQPAATAPSVQPAANTAAAAGTSPLVVISGSHNHIGDIIINMADGTIRLSSDTYDDHRPGPQYTRQSGGQKPEEKS